MDLDLNSNEAYPSTEETIILVDSNWEENDGVKCIPLSEILQLMEPEDSIILDLRKLIASDDEIEPDQEINEASDPNIIPKLPVRRAHGRPPAMTKEEHELKQVMTSYFLPGHSTAETCRTTKLGEDCQYSAEEKEEDDDDLYFTCPVCTFEMAYETIEQSGHIFCKSCILEALLEKEFCPIPHFGEEEEEEDSASDSDSSGNENPEDPIN